MCDGTGLHGDDGDAVALGFFCLVPFLLVEVWSVNHVIHDHVVRLCREMVIDLKVEADARFVCCCSQSYGINADEQEGILKYLIAGGDLSLYGLSNAVTRASQDVAS